jgi:hypothetical protein
VRIPSRRRVLAAGALAVPLLAGGCKGIGALGTPPKPGPDVAVAWDAIAGEEHLIARYGEVLAAVPALAVTLRPILAQHREHRARLHSRLIVPRASGRPTGVPPGATPGAQASAGRAGAGPPGTGRAGAGQLGTAAAALAYLQDAERAAAASLVGHLQVASPSFAQLLASIAASEATHALLLASHGRAG